LKNIKEIKEDDTDRSPIKSTSLAANLLRKKTIKNNKDVRKEGKDIIAQIGMTIRKKLDDQISVGSKSIVLDGPSYGERKTFGEGLVSAAASFNNTAKKRRQTTMLKQNSTTSGNIMSDEPEILLR